MTDQPTNPETCATCRGSGQTPSVVGPTGKRYPLGAKKPNPAPPPNPPSPKDELRPLCIAPVARPCGNTEPCPVHRSPSETDGMTQICVPEPNKYVEEALRALPDGSLRDQMAHAMKSCKGREDPRVIELKLKLRRAHALLSAERMANPSPERARLDEDRTAKPKTEIRGVCHVPDDGRARTLWDSSVDEYVVRPTETSGAEGTAPAHAQDSGRRPPETTTPTRVPEEAGTLTPEDWKDISNGRDEPRTPDIGPALGGASTAPSGAGAAAGVDAPARLSSDAPCGHDARDSATVCLMCREIAYTAGTAKARREAVAGIVTWLRNLKGPTDLQLLADEIECTSLSEGEPRG